MRTVAATFIIILMLDGCSDIGVLQNDGLSASTQRSSYTTNESITFVISNAGNQTALLPGCCDRLAFFIDRYENGAWTEFGGFGIPCEAFCMARPVVLPAQSQHAHSHMLPQAGVYRFRFPYGFASGQEMTKEFPSNQFTVQ